MEEAQGEKASSAGPALVPRLGFGVAASRRHGGLRRRRRAPHVFSLPPQRGAFTSLSHAAGASGFLVEYPTKNPRRRETRNHRLGRLPLAGGWAVWKFSSTPRRHWAAFLQRH